MSVPSLLLRKIHKWVGILVGIQFLLWTISGAAMALIDMKAVAGGERAVTAPVALPDASGQWQAIQASLGNERVQSIRTDAIAGTPILRIETGTSVRLFDARTGHPVTVNGSAAEQVAQHAYPGGQIERVVSLDDLTLAVRDHSLPIWRVDFDDAQNSSFYVSGTSGQILEQRNNSWRVWDFFWMLHNMDYAERSSFNHPLIIFAGIAMVWLAVTGFWLLFRTVWKHDISFVRRKLG